MRNSTIAESVEAHRNFPGAQTVDIMPDGSMIPHYFKLMCEASPDAIATVWIQ